VHLLSVRVDAVDRRLVQLEAIERRMNEFADVNRRLMDLNQLEQRVTRVEEMLMTSDSDKTVGEVGRLDMDVDHAGGGVAVMNSVGALVKQLNNLSARMTLTENQLMLQVSTGTVHGPRTGQPG